jgi:hypothetical protein
MFDFSAVAKVKLEHQRVFPWPKRSGRAVALQDHDFMFRFFETQQLPMMLGVCVISGRCCWNKFDNVFRTR